MTVEQVNPEAGLAAHQAGDLMTAANIYDACLRSAPDNPDLLHLRGLVYHQTGDQVAALRAIDRALAKAPGTPLFLGSRGVVLLASGDPAAACQALESAHQGRPDDPKILTNLGLARGRMGDIDAARACHDQALARDPNCVDALINRGNLRERLDDIDGAVEDLAAAHELAPDNADILNNLGFACLSGNRTGEARRALTTALTLSPTHVEAAVNLSHLDLLTGDFVKGWRGYEARRQRASWHVASPACPEWQGEDISGRTVLVVCEQGYGDVIQFARHALDLLDRGASVDLYADACIADLLTTVPGVGKVVSDASGEDWDYWVPAMSLPFRLGLDGPPGIAAAYLTAPRTVVTLTRGTGFCYRGNPRHRNDARRSLPEDMAASFLEGRDEVFISLNRDNTPDNSASPEGMRGRTDIEDFTDLARIIAGLDLVISVDTAVAHLAGALGRPCWLLLPFSPDWRWGLDSEVTSLYPEMRLFRQPLPGDWSSVLSRVAAELDKRS